MVILKQKRITNNGEGKGYFRNCIDYVYKEKIEYGEALVLRGGFGVSYSNPDHTYNQMYAVKKYFGKTGDNPVMHFIVSFDNTVDDSILARQYMSRIAILFARDYQVIYALHREDQGGSKYHGHIIINTVNYKNGKLYHSGRKELGELAIAIKNITGIYCKPIIETINEY